MSDKLKLSLTRVSLPVDLEVTEGKFEEYEIREMTASARDKYLDSMASRFNTDASGTVTSVKNYDGLQAALLTSCLFKKGEDAPVSKDIIQSWPASSVASLFDAAKNLNHLGRDEQPKKV